MKAIVLSCDRYHPFAHHMVKCYDAIWPDHPFEFHIPYTDDKPSGWTSRNAIVPVKTPRDIKGCALALLDACNDEEWIYWAIDDKYPLHLDVKAAARAVQFVEGDPGAQTAALCISRSRGLAVSDLVDAADQITVAKSMSALRRLRFNQIWYHQFIRAGVLKYMFNTFPDGGFKARQMDFMIRDLAMPEARKLYVTEENYSLYGESTVAGAITANCARSMADHGLALPDGFNITHEEILMGDKASLPRKVARKVLNVFRKSA